MSRHLLRPRIAALFTLALLSLSQLPAQAHKQDQSETAVKSEKADKKAARSDARLKWYAEQLKQFPNQPELYYQLGLLQAQSGSADEAQASFASAIRLDPTMYQAAWQLARLQLEGDQPQKAVETLTPAIAKWHVEPELYYLLGLSYQQLGQKSEALRAFEKVLQLAPEHAALKYRDALRGELPTQAVAAIAPLQAKIDGLIKAKNMAAAQQSLQALIEVHPEDKAAYNQLANLLEASGQFAPAAALRAQLQQLDGCFENNAGLLGRWQLWSGNFTAADALLTRQFACRKSVEVARWICQLHRLRGDANDALRQYQAQLALYPGDPELLSGQAATLLALGRLPEARAALAQIKAPGPEALFVRSQLAMASGQAADAIRDLTLAVAASNRPEYHKALGLAYVQAGMGEPARLELLKYLQARPAETASLQPLLEQIKALPKRGRFE